MKKEISKELIDLINTTEFKKALNEYNFNECYEIINKELNLPTHEFTELLFDIGINPLDYMSKIPKYFLYNADIKTFKIPSNIKSIEKDAFNGCTSLREILIPDNVISIGLHAFQFCTLFTSIIIPDSVTSIGDMAFQACTSLKSAKIGRGVTSIGWEAFGYCALLTTITYTGTMTQWNAIKLDSNWNIGVPATIIHCIDGDVNL